MTTPHRSGTSEPGEADPGAGAEPYAGVVVAGGTAQRLGGIDKPMLDVGGSTLLARSLAALSGADPVVVVGPRRPGIAGVVWTREQPPGTGPVAALAAGLTLVQRSRVVVLAGDLRAVTPTVVHRLLEALEGTSGHRDAQPLAAGDRPAMNRDADRAGAVDGAVLVDGDGRRQWLMGAWRTAALRVALPDEPAGASLRRVLGGLTIVDVPARGDETADVDTIDDLP